jgi:hypothetical protein
MTSIAIGLVGGVMGLVATAIWCIGRIVVAVLRLVLPRRISYPKLKVVALAPFVFLTEAAFRPSGKPRT